MFTMKVTPFEKLPAKMQNKQVKFYHDILIQKGNTLTLKRLLDIFICLVLVVLSSPFLLLFGLLIKLTSKGEIIFKQQRIGRDLKPFYIFKFRTMVQNADSNGVLLTTGHDSRITGLGKFLRAINMDEVPQLFNVLKGDMSIIGTRPEVLRYVDIYTDEMYATLLLPPGMLSLASIKYKNENAMLDGVQDPQKIYIEKILPDKMKYNLQYLEELSVKKDFSLIGMSIKAAF